MFSGLDEERFSGFLEAMFSDFLEVACSDFLEGTFSGLDEGRFSDFLGAVFSDLDEDSTPRFSPKAPSCLADSEAREPGSTSPVDSCQVGAFSPRVT